MRASARSDSAFSGHCRRQGMVCLSRRQPFDDPRQVLDVWRIYSSLRQSRSPRSTRIELPIAGRKLLILVFLLPKARAASPEMGFWPWLPLLLAEVGSEARLGDIWQGFVDKAIMFDTGHPAGKLEKLVDLASMSGGRATRDASA